MADDRLAEALADLARILRAGVNVVSSAPVFLQYPAGVVPDELVDADPRGGRRGRRVAVGQRHRPGLRERLAAARAHLGVRAHRPGALPGDPRLRHLRQRQGAVRHHGLRPAARRHPDAAACPACCRSPGAAWCASSPPGWASSSTASRSRRPGCRRRRRSTIAAGTDRGRHGGGAAVRGARDARRAGGVRARARDAAARRPRPGLAAARRAGRLPRRGHRRAELHARPAADRHRRRPQHGRPQGHRDAAGERDPGGRRGASPAC